MKLELTVGERTLAIAAVLRTLPLGGSMTYKDLSSTVGFNVTNSNAHYRGAVNRVLKEGISIRAGDPKKSFRRLTADEMAEGKHRFNAIRRQARRGGYEAKEALRSNDPRTQAKASIASAKYAVLSSTKPITNRDVPDDRI